MLQGAVDAGEAMQVRQGDRVILDARAKAEPAESVVTEDFYTQLARLRLSPDPTSRQTHPEIPTDVTLDEIDVAILVAVAVRHPAFNMRQSVLAAIWEHPQSFRQLFRFGLEAPDDFCEIRKIVAEELARCAPIPGSPTPGGAARAAEKLLPRMPAPAHLRERKSKQ